KALSTWSTKMTRAATTTNWAMILIFPGITFRKREITTLPTPMTKSTDMAMTTDAFNSAVMAKSEQIPNTWMVMGLLSARGSNIRFASFFDKSAILFLSYGF